MTCGCSNCKCKSEKMDWSLKLWIALTIYVLISLGIFWLSRIPYLVEAYPKITDMVSTAMVLSGGATSILWWIAVGVMSFRLRDK